MRAEADVTADPNLTLPDDHIYAPRRWPPAHRPETPVLANIFMVGVSSKRVLVELLGRYSKMVKPSVMPQISTEQYGQIERTSQRRVHDLRRRLAPEVIEQMVADYQAGMSSALLAESLGVSKSAVLGLLGERGVQMRRPPFSEQEAERAVALYAEGLSTAAIGDRLDRTQSTVWRALKARGVELRPRNGWS